MSENNPIVGIEDKFYTNSDEPDLKEVAVSTEVTKPDDQLPSQDEVIIDKPSEDKPIKGELTPEELAADDEDKESLFVEIDGEEIDLKVIKQWRDNGLMQSDYTKKTTEHSQFAKKEREEIALDRENLSKANESIITMQDELSVLVAEDDLIDWAELKEDEPEEYIKLREKADQRKEALAKVRAERETPTDDPAFLESERQKFWALNPEWLDDEKKTTEVFTKDTALMNKYIANAGFTSDEFGKMTTSRQLSTILKAAKYDELQEKGRKIRDEKDKIPVVTKPKVNATQSKNMEDVFYN